MRALFKDERRQREYEANGYAVVDFLEEPQLQGLLGFYRALEGGEIADRLHSVMDRHPQQIRRMREEFARLAAETIRREFDGCTLMMANFLVKKPNPRGFVTPHQDWTSVDESQVSSGCAWVPLGDTDLSNGTLGVLRGSHRYFADVRCSPSVHSYARLPYAAYAASIFPYMDFPSLRAGQAVVFHAGAIHGSLPNETAEVRIAATFSLLPAEAQLYHHYLLPGSDFSAFESYAVDREFFMDYTNGRLTALFDAGKRPEGLKSLGVHDFRPTKIAEGEMIELMRARGAVRDPAVAARLP